ncbi:hypothetical protein Hrd1104_13030 [Halorhabdus sp. CBA1104]|uniref:DUF5813 family protein n=1 Tax=unclassified Halorhabdus TaxID=2621901 RepID=UPI0012B1D62F|nr:MULTISPECIES: DUF5813 family protein [unclassified Halorhabdus]QGN08128.1 hypothetical protein Hrd1104_13030 [Halorhabdus sp. CBA1104]
MTADLPTAVADAMAAHDAFEAGNDRYRVTTTAFDGTVTATETDGVGYEFTVTVRAPMLGAAIEDEVVGPAVEEGWFDTYERRLEDAPKATRAQVELDSYDLREQGREAIATFRFTFGDAARGVEIAKTIVEYVEGTYVEGVVPGYEYGSPVADLLQRATTTGSEPEAESDDSGGRRGGTPL